MRKHLAELTPYLLIVVGFLAIYTAILSGKVRSKQTNAYIRVTSCIISKNAKDRTQQDIEVCYQRVEHDTGIKLIRYDK